MKPSDLIRFRTGCGHTIVYDNCAHGYCPYGNLVAKIPSGDLLMILDIIGESFFLGKVTLKVLYKDVVGYVLVYSDTIVCC